MSVVEWFTYYRNVCLFRERIRHQQAEVDEAKKRLGQVGYSKDYLDRMTSNCNASRKELRDYVNKMKKL